MASTRVSLFLVLRKSFSYHQAAQTKEVTGRAIIHNALKWLINITLTVATEHARFRHRICTQKLPSKAAIFAAQVTRAVLMPCAYDEITKFAPTI